MTKQIAVVAAAVVAWVAMADARPAPRADRLSARVDAVFAKYTADTPGCAVGIAQNGSPVLTKGYGMADLEHDVPNTPDTIFEAGSVSKQFTAAAVLLLARDGKLSLDDPVRKYIPELPDYGAPLLVRHMLNHTSGLRDWGSVAGISGWPRTTRVHTHAHVLDIISRQTSLNFPSGTRWSYSNTGFNLAAIIVSRVSGVPFAEFTRDRIFKPLGMMHTSWRDDFTRIVKGRAIAYEQRDGVFHIDMPFENVYGNGGLLTTVGDLLKWNDNFQNPIVGDASFVREEQQPGRFNDGRQHGYALGLFVGSHRGVGEVYHSGSTAGYSAFLTRFPEKRLSIAVLCNVATNATTLAHATADVFLEPPGTAAPEQYPPLTDEQKRQIPGLYRNLLTGATENIGLADDLTLKLQNGASLPPRGLLTFVSDSSDVWVFDGQGHLFVTDQFGTVDRYEQVDRVSPTPAELQAYEGVYRSGDAETEMTAAVDHDRLVLKRRPATTIPLTPLYADAFRAGGLGTIVFRRDATRAVTALSVVQDRVWDMRFAKQPPQAGRDR